MNKQLIEKIIKTNDQQCPEIVYENPLLDKNVAIALSKSFVNILNATTDNSNINNNLRIAVLENIRRICQTEPDSHCNVDEGMTELLTDVINTHLTNATDSTLEDSNNKQLDTFLLRKMKGLNIDSSFKPSLNPEILQALINLNENGVYLERLSKDIIHWNVINNKYLSVVKHLWNENDVMSHCSNIIDDMSIKMKSEIERILLNVCHDVLVNNLINLEDVFTTHKDVTNLVMKCAMSADCYQMCCGILNFIFIMTNFDPHIQHIINVFVNRVKLNCPQLTFSVLYPLHLNHIVVLMDFELDVLPAQLKNMYIQPALKYLKNVHSECENDLIMLLSHFPQWFDVYFNQNV